MFDFTISSGHFSHDIQVFDALNYIESLGSIDGKNAIAKLHAEFPETVGESIVWEGSWVDCEASNVDFEYTSWLCDAIEETGLVYWCDGEPWANALTADTSEGAV